SSQSQRTKSSSARPSVTIASTEGELKQVCLGSDRELAVFALPKRRLWPTLCQIAVDSPYATGATEKNDERDEEDSCVFTVRRPEHAALRQHVIQKQKHGDGGADARHRSGEKRKRGHRFTGHNQVTEQGCVRDDDVLHEMQVRRRRPARCDTAKKPQHFRREWVVAGQLAQNRDEQNHAEIDAQDDEQRARNGPRCEPHWHLTGIIRNFAMWNGGRCVHDYCVATLGFNSQSTLMIFQSPLNFATSR